MQRQPSGCRSCRHQLVRLSGMPQMIDTESWASLTERGVASCTQMRSVDDDGVVLRKQMDQLVENFRIVRLAACLNQIEQSL